MYLLLLKISIYPVWFSKELKYIKFKIKKFMHSTNKLSVWLITRRFHITNLNWSLRNVFVSIFKILNCHLEIILNVQKFVKMDVL